MNKSFKRFFATLVALVVCFSAMSAFAASRKNYSDWFDLDRINAIDVEEDLTDEANREEFALLIAELCDKLELLPSKATLDFEDEREFDSSYSYRMITRLSSTGIANGYPNGDFGPENDITRAEGITMIMRLVDYFCLETDSYRRGTAFTDTKGHWAEVYCQRAYEEGLISGRGNGRFYPDDEITREELITILVNLMGESNNSLIYAVDKLYDLEFDNSYYVDEDEDDRYDDYYDRYDDYYDRTERPKVDLDDYKDDSSSTSSSSSSGTTVRPPRPTVDLTSSSSTVDTGSKPARPTVDLTTSSTTKVERPTVEVETSTSVERPTVEVEETVSSSRPARPTV